MAICFHGHPPFVSSPMTIILPNKKKLLYFLFIVIFTKMIFSFNSLNFGQSTNKIEPTRSEREEEHFWLMTHINNDEAKCNQICESIF